MKLYSGPISLFTSKVRIALAEKRLGYDRIEVDWSFENAYRPHHPDVDRLNPKGQVPILVDGDVVVTDSTLILEYLEDRHPTPALHPDGVAARARCRRLEAYADEIVFPEVWELIAQNFHPAGADGRDAARAERAVARLGELYEEIDRELTGTEWLCDRFSVADIAIHVMTATAAVIGAPADRSLTNLSAWQRRIQARPSIRNETVEMMEFLAHARAERAS